MEAFLQDIKALLQSEICDHCNQMFTVLNTFLTIYLSITFTLFLNMNAQRNKEF